MLDVNPWKDGDPHLPFPMTWTHRGMARRALRDVAAGEFGPEGLINKALKLANDDPLVAYAYLLYQDKECDLQGSEKEQWAIQEGLKLLISRAKQGWVLESAFDPLRRHLALWDVDSPDSWVEMMVAYHRNWVFDVWFEECVKFLYDRSDVQELLSQSTTYTDLVALKVGREGAVWESWGRLAQEERNAVSEIYGNYEFTDHEDLTPTGLAVKGIFFGLGHFVELGVPYLIDLAIKADMAPLASVSSAWVNARVEYYWFMCANLLYRLFLQYIEHHPMTQALEKAVKESVNAEQLGIIRGNLEEALF